MSSGFLLLLVIVLAYWNFKGQRFVQRRRKKSFANHARAAIGELSQILTLYGTIALLVLIVLAAIASFFLH